MATSRYLVLWWTSGTPYAALFESELAAEAASRARNAVMVTFAGAAVEEVVDWYRRDDDGRPMPAEWRELADSSRIVEFLRSTEEREAVEAA